MQDERERLLDLFIGQLSNYEEMREDRIPKLTVCLAGVRYAFVAMPGDEEFGPPFEAHLA
jgi:hypothetical protein